MQVKPLVLIKGAATFLPGAMRFACSGSGGTDVPRYCYTVWLRHLIRLADAGIDTNFTTVAELGPGDSLGIGLSAMLTGADRYFALDAMPHARLGANRQTFDALVHLFDAREPLPHENEFPEMWPPVAAREFPADAIGTTRLQRSLQPRRIDAIRFALHAGRSEEVEIQYAAPWMQSSILHEETADLIISQAVLEHVEDVDATYIALIRWLKPGGVMSHQIDFRSHSLTRDWYGHWTIRPWMWRLVRGRRPYLINRLPVSFHIDAMIRHGFEIVQQIRLRAEPPKREELAAEFRAMTDDDLRTASVFVIARKPRGV